MDIKDRGMKKWHGFFMPEHISGLKQMWLDQHKVQMPQLDDYQLQEFEERINFAKENTLPIEFIVYDNGFTESITGKIKSIDQINREIKLFIPDGTVEYICFSEIINVEVKD